MSTNREPLIRVVRTPPTKWRVARALLILVVATAVVVTLVRDDTDVLWFVPLVLLLFLLEWWDTFRSGLTNLFKKASGTGEPSPKF